MKLNGVQIEIMLLNFERNSDDCNFIGNKTILEPAKELNSLGVTSDECLNFVKKLREYVVNRLAL